MAFLVVGAVQLLGFTSSGIAAGSAAASMMSAAAPVAAGSVVAVCQSIGATGALSAGATLVANTLFGAGAAGGAAGGVALIVRRFRRQGDSDDGSDGDKDGSDDDNDVTDGDDKGNDGEDKGDNTSKNDVNIGDIVDRASAGANEGTKVCDVDDHISHNIDGAVTNTATGTTDDEDACDNNGEVGLDSEEENGRVSPSLRNNERYSAKFTNLIKCDQNKRDDYPMGVDGSNNDTDVGVGDKRVVSVHIDVGCNQSNNTGSGDGNEDHSRGDGRIDGVDGFGQPVYNIYNELYDPSTGEAVVEI